MIYLDNAATTFPKPRCVYDDADKFYRENSSYPGRGNYNSSIKVYNLIEETRKAILKLFNAEKNYTVIFTPSATISLNTIICGLNLKDDINIYISPFEHNAVIRTLENLKTKFNLNIQKLIVNKNNLMYNISKISDQFENNKPDVIIVNHASNVIGLVAPVEEIFNMSKRYNSINILDSSQTAGNLEIDLKKIKADCVVIAGHKSLYSPFGISGIILNTNIKINPIIFGGTGLDSGNSYMPIEYPERLEPGSISTYSIAGLNSSLKWIMNTGIKNVFKKEKTLLKYTLQELNKLENVMCYVPKGIQIPVLSFIVRGYSSDEVGRILNNKEVEVRTGLHCSPDAHKLIGTYPSGTVRISIGYFNTKFDIDQLIGIIKQL